jgi:protein-S-isoprenylcysteine O-methyltransferase Ste14
VSDDHPLRLILFVGFLIYMPMGIRYRLKSHTGEKLDRRQEGSFVLITLRLCGIAAMLVFLAWLINPAWMAWAAVPLPAWLRWVGLGFGLIAGPLILWTFHSLGRNLTDTVVTRMEHTLVESGPYRWVRHPLYTAAALAFLGNALATANAFLFVTGFVAIVLLVVRTRKEEANLVARFGNAYRDYIRRTGRFLPLGRRPGKLLKF